MDISWHIAVAGAIVGFIVGLTGMGGGALMTPILVIFFNIQPLAAVSSDLVASLIMRPVGAGVHWRAKTVKAPLVKWLCIGSVPAAFAGVMLLKALPGGAQLQDRLKIALGAALLLAVVGIIARFVIDRRKGAVDDSISHTVHVHRGRTIAIGVFGGLIVGMTSVGSGSLMIVLLMLLYPVLSMRELVGTDLVQALPLVASATLGQFLFGDVHIGLATSLIIGGIPAVYLGARLSSRAPSWFVRRALAVVLLATALKLLDVSTNTLGLTTAVAAVVALASAVPEVRRILANRREKQEEPAEEQTSVAA
ncbi:MAG: sulfite exporter TauE/SafE family protein [Actinomycetes bacterium]